MAKSQLPTHGAPSAVVIFWTRHSSEPNIETKDDPQDTKDMIDGLRKDTDVTKIAVYSAHSVEERVTSFKTLL